jgi:hypothetical protein
MLSRPLILYVCYSVRAENEVQAGHVTTNLYAPVSTTFSTCITNCAHVLIDRCTRAGRRRSGTACGALDFVNRHPYPPRSLIDRHGGRFCEYKRRIDLFHCLTEQSTAHSDPEDDHLRRESLVGKKETHNSVGGFHLPVTHESEYAGGLGTQRTENIVQTNPNA